MSTVIDVERPDTPDSVALVNELQTHLESFYQPVSRHGFTVERLVSEGVAFFVLRVDGQAAGCGGIKLFGIGVGHSEPSPGGRGQGEGAGNQMQDNPLANTALQSEPFGELKRMYVRPNFRGHGYGKLILDRLAQHASENNITLLRLETGIYQTEAIRLYEQSGFHRIPPFGNYTNDPVSLCYEKRIGRESR